MLIVHIPPPPRKFFCVCRSWWQQWFYFSNLHRIWMHKTNNSAWFYKHSPCTLKSYRLIKVKLCVANNARAPTKSASVQDAHKVFPIYKTKHKTPWSAQQVRLSLINTLNQNGQKGLVETVKATSMSKQTHHAFPQWKKKKRRKNTNKERKKEGNGRQKGPTWWQDGLVNRTPNVPHGGKIQTPRTWKVRKWVKSTCFCCSSSLTFSSFHGLYFSTAGSSWRGPCAYVDAILVALQVDRFRWLHAIAS